MLERKKSLGFKAKGAITIIVRAIFFVKRLQLLIKWKSTHPELYHNIKTALKKEYNIIRKHKQYCHKMFCYPNATRYQYNENNELTTTTRQICNNNSKKHHIVDDNKETTIGNWNTNNTAYNIKLPYIGDSMCTSYSSDKKPKLNHTIQETNYLSKMSPKDFSLLTYLEEITTKITNNIKTWQFAQEYIKQLVMCILAAYNEDSESTSNNFIMFRTEIAHNLFISYGVGRNQRHLKGENFVDKGAVLTKFIKLDSELGMTTLKHCHTVSAFVHKNLTVKEMLKLGVYIYQFRYHLKRMAQNCQKCRLNINRMRRKDYAMKESLISTNERFLTCAFNTAMNIVTMDLLGPHIIHCQQETGCTTKFWILLTITQADGRVHLTAMNAYSANAFLTAALTLANRIGSFAVITTDAGSQLKPFATSMSEISEKSNHLNDHWKNLIASNKNTLENGGVIFKIVAPGRHQSVSICETIVHRIKEMFGKFHH